LPDDQHDDTSGASLDEGGWSRIRKRRYYEWRLAMDKDLEEWRYQEFGIKPKYLLPSWEPLAILITGLERPSLNDGEKAIVAEAGHAMYSSKFQPKTPWYSRTSRQVGRWLATAGSRLEGIGRRLERRSGCQTITSTEESASG
jgi:hypothetical protein